MPALTATVSSTEAVKLSPSVRKKLLTKLHTYASLKAQLEPIKLAMKKLTDELGAIRDEATGEMSLKLDGVATITLVAGTYKKFNPKTYVSLGGDLAIYQQAVDEKPKKAYNKVTLVGEKAEESDD